jgi:hypothetical protein
MRKAAERNRLQTPVIGRTMPYPPEQGDCRAGLRLRKHPGFSAPAEDWQHGLRILPLPDGRSEGSE